MSPSLKLDPKWLKIWNLTPNDWKFEIWPQMTQNLKFDPKWLKIWNLTPKIQYQFLGWRRRSRSEGRRACNAASRSVEGQGGQGKKLFWESKFCWFRFFSFHKCLFFRRSRITTTTSLTLSWNWRCSVGVCLCLCVGAHFLCLSAHFPEVTWLCAHLGHFFEHFQFVEFWLSLS